MVPLRPEYGDKVETYEHEIVQNPATGAIGPVLKVNVDAEGKGTCVYLGEKGCTIWERAPAVCKAFDCRILFASLNREERRGSVKPRKDHQGRWYAIHNAQALQEGKKRLDTLTDYERANAKAIQNRKP